MNNWVDRQMKKITKKIEIDYLFCVRENDERKENETRQSERQKVKKKKQREMEEKFERNYVAKERITNDSVFSYG